MTLLNEIKDATKKNHEWLHQDPFIKRYQEDVTAKDHYQHLSQLLPIYQALEVALADSPLLSTLPDELAILRHRSEAIKADMAWIERDHPEHPCLTEATVSYVADIQALSASKNDEALLGHLLTRLLGDMLGGQKIKGHLGEAYQRGGLLKEDSKSTDGRQFYDFPEGVMKSFIGWMNRLPLEEGKRSQVTSAADAAMCHLLIMYRELEEWRGNDYKPVHDFKHLLDDLNQSMQSVEPQWVKNTATFFHQNRRELAIGGGVAVALAVGAAVAVRHFRQ